MMLNLSENERSYLLELLTANRDMLREAELDTNTHKLGDLEKINAQQNYTWAMIRKLSK